MLVLHRKAGQSLVIGDNITIHISEVSGDGVRIAIDAPRDVKITRKELVEAAIENKEAVVRNEKGLSQEALTAISKFTDKNSRKLAEDRISDEKEKQ